MGMQRGVRRRANPNFSMRENPTVIYKAALLKTPLSSVRLFGRNLAKAVSIGPPEPNETAWLLGNVGQRVVRTKIDFQK